MVDAVGAAVKEFSVGDHAFGNNGFNFGAYAEFLCIRESALIAHMPTGICFEEAAAICDGGLNALWCLRQANLKPGQKVLIYGASGAIGTAGVQLARSRSPASNQFAALALWHARSVTTFIPTRSTGTPRRFASRPLKAG
ncbi:hypothetical protein [Ktedonospora formicarum]|uniref:hypothetical protein n=1 Tax=Ktedonospora formicarum TaxID=2778364 RepID=UPI001F300C5B|nr:hypothetical protein [Ktedonospora formicarum]